MTLTQSTAPPSNRANPLVERTVEKPPAVWGEDPEGRANSGRVHGERSASAAERIAGHMTESQRRSRLEAIRAIEKELGAEKPSRVRAASGTRDRVVGGEGEAPRRRGATGTGARSGLIEELLKIVNDPLKFKFIPKAALAPTGVALARGVAGKSERPTGHMSMRPHSQNMNRNRPSHIRDMAGGGGGGREKLLGSPSTSNHLKGALAGLNVDDVHLLQWDF